jgi:hypothetical protein
VGRVAIRLGRGSFCFAEVFLLFGKLVGTVFILVSDQIGLRLLGRELGRRRGFGIPVFGELAGSSSGKEVGRRHGSHFTHTT